MSVALPPRRRASRAAWLLVAAAAALYGFGLWWIGASPLRIWRGLDQLGTILALMWPPTPGSHLVLYLQALGQTVSIALLGTLGAAVFAVPFGALAARNVVANRLLHMLTRRGLDTIRSVDTLIWALIWIDVVGLGPFAGALAKLVSEAIETADRRPAEGVLSVGGSRLAVLRFGIVPQVLPIVASQLLYFFESNTRSATIIGIVGAGGIGLHLYEQIRVLQWDQAAFLILLVLLTVALIDQLSSRLRAAM